MPAWLIRTGDPTPRHANRFNFVLSFVYSLLLFVVLNVVHVSQTSLILPKTMKSYANDANLSKLNFPPANARKNSLFNWTLDREELQNTKSNGIQIRVQPFLSQMILQFFEPWTRLTRTSASRSPMAISFAPLCVAQSTSTCLTRMDGLTLSSFQTYTTTLTLPVSCYQWISYGSSIALPPFFVANVHNSSRMMAYPYLSAAIQDVAIWSMSPQLWKLMRAFGIAASCTWEMPPCIVWDVSSRLLRSVISISRNVTLVCKGVHSARQTLSDPLFARDL